MFHFYPLELFWVDIALQNPLDTEVTFTDLTLVVEAKDQDVAWINKYVVVECIGEVVLHAKEIRTVSFQKTKRPAILGTHAFRSI